MPNSPVEPALSGISAQRSLLPPLALFLLICILDVEPIIHRIENRTPKIRLHSYTIHPGIGRDGQFSQARVAQYGDKLDAMVMALDEFSFSGQVSTTLDFPGKGTLINAGVPGQNLRIR